MGKNVFWGLMLIVIGVLLTINQVFNIDFFSMNNFWPLFILLPGLMFQISYFISRRNPGILVPGGILTTIGILFFFEVFTDWNFAEYTWPVYILAVAIGLFQLYIFGERNRGLLIPVFILTTISIVSFLSMIIRSSFIMPVIFIIAGVYLLVRNYTSSR